MNRTADEPKNVRKAAETPKVNVRPLNNLRSSIGASVRSSHQMKVASIATVPAKAAMIGGDVQPALLPVVMASSSATKMPVDNAAPHQSNLVPLLS